MHKKALKIIFPGLLYMDALVHCGLRALSDRCAAACTKFIQRARDTGVLANLLAQRTTVSHGYNLRSCTIRDDPAMAANNRVCRLEKLSSIRDSMAISLSRSILMEISETVSTSPSISSLRLFVLFRS